MSKHSTLRIGGPAKCFLAIQNAPEAVKAIEAAKKDGFDYVVIGGGSNILVSDAGFEGLVIKMADLEIKIDGEKVYVGAGVFSAMLGRATAEAGMTGLEWMATLPGTVGGAVYGNAGAYGEETKDRLARVKILQEDLSSAWIPKKDCAFGYRESRFKKTKEIILGAEFLLETSNKEQATRKINELLEKRKSEQPLGSSSAGCVFKNYEVGNRPFEDVEKYFDKDDMDMIKRFWVAGRVPAGWLVEKAGMKGFCIGKICVSERHGNFTLTQNGATADQLIQLISAVKMKVRDTFGIELQEEVQYIGF